MPDVTIRNLDRSCVGRAHFAGVRGSAVRLLAIWCVAQLMAGAAAAQSPQRDDPVSVADMRRVADDFGQCMTFTFPDASRRIVLEPVDHAEAFRRFRTEISGRCLNENDASGAPVQMELPYPTLHAILADNLIRRDFRDSGPGDLSEAPTVQPLSPPVLPPPAAMSGMNERQIAAITAQRESQDSWIVLQRIGLCTARRAPVPVRQMALTRVGSDEERAALRTLAQHVGGCVPTGSTVRLRPAELRWAVALGYYRLARASLAAPQGTP